MDVYLLTASVVVVLVFGYGAVKHAVNAFRFRNRGGVRGFSIFGFSLFCIGVAMATVVIYVLNLVGVLPNPLPAHIGRFLIIMLGVLVVFAADAIRRLAP